MARENKVNKTVGVCFVLAICFLRSTTGLVWLTYEVDEDVF